MEEYGREVEERLFRETVEEIKQYLLKKKAEGKVGCASFSEIETLLKIPRERLEETVPYAQDLNYIKKGKMFVTIMGTSYTEDDYVALPGEDCFGGMAGTAMDLVSNVKIQAETLRDIKQNTDNIPFMVQKLKDIEDSVIITEDNVLKMKRKLEELYEVISKNIIRRKE